MEQEIKKINRSIKIYPIFANAFTSETEFRNYNEDVRPGRRKSGI